ncbi:conserved Plasmodium protein, unknown function [Plasmodium vinckei brucechwatti]|uniref:Suppressor of forked domain-containing protein n=1 Tax=Plasmodium vinckei brucechwatti TaxID=119398 RepID=A0A6V7SL07_PLAVN|nr:conserved Plasmodium protein, unknown function [Plasmodium vinckei brucechwatti]
MIKIGMHNDSVQGEEENDGLVTAKELFETHLKVDDRIKLIFKNFNSKEYVEDLMESKFNDENENNKEGEMGSSDLNSSRVKEPNNENGEEEWADEQERIDYKKELNFLKENPLHINRWNSFLEAYDREEAYEPFLLIFPRCVNYWIKYAELKIKKKKYKEAYNIYRKCINSNIYDLKLFISFLYFTYHTSSIHEYISFLFEALKYVGTDIKSGYIWVELLYILIKIYNTNLLLNNDIQNLLYDPFKNINHNNRKKNENKVLIPSEQEQKIYKSYIPKKSANIKYIEHYTSDDKLKKYYLSWLNNPTKFLDKVWKGFCSYEKTTSLNFTNSSLFTYNSQYTNSKNAYKELCMLYKELYNLKKSKTVIIPINSVKCKMENNLLYKKWMKIINFEKKNPLKLKLSLVRKRIMYVYEQALIHLQFNSDLWFSYFQFLLLNKKYDYAIRIMREAIEIYLPFDELLKLNFAYFFEKNSLINQAHFIYQLMINDITKKKKKFSLSYLYSKKIFKNLPYSYINGKGRKKRKRKPNSQKNTNSNLCNNDDEDDKKELAEEEQQAKKAKLGNSEIENVENIDEENIKENNDNIKLEEIPFMVDEYIKKRFNQSDYEQIDERKKYFVNYINIDKNKKRDFVFTHFLNFIKRNYDETIWRYYVGIILNEKKCSQYMYYYCANMERRLLNNEKRATYIMNEGYEKYSKKKKFILYYISFLLEKGSIDKIRCLVYKFIHNIYSDFYKEYDKKYGGNNNIGSANPSGIDNSGNKKDGKTKITQNEFNQFESRYLKLLKKKNKACEKIWNLLTQLEILYGDIQHINKVYETKLKYESGYNFDENKNILLNFGTISKQNEMMMLEDNSITDILCKGYLENLKKNDVDNISYKINLINSQLFAGTSFKDTFFFFHPGNSINVLSTSPFNNLRNEKKKKKKKNDKDKYGKENDKAFNIDQQAYKDDSNYGDENVPTRTGLYKNVGKLRRNIKNEDDMASSNEKEHSLNPKKKKNLYNKNNQMNATYDSFNFLDAEYYTKKKKKKKSSNNNNTNDNAADGTGELSKNMEGNNPVNYISRPDLKMMSIYKPFENIEHLEEGEKGGGTNMNNRNTRLNENKFFMNKLNKGQKFEDTKLFLKREYFAMPNIINDFLSLLPEENSNLKLSDNSIDYLMASLQNLFIPKLKDFPYEPIPVKDIIKLKEELDS